MQSILIQCHCTETPSWLTAAGFQDELVRELKQTLSSIKLEEKGVYVQASTLGSLEALLEFLRTSKVPVSTCLSPFTASRLFQDIYSEKQQEAGPRRSWPLTSVCLCVCSCSTRASTSVQFIRRTWWGRRRCWSTTYSTSLSHPLFLLSFPVSVCGRK